MALGIARGGDATRQNRPWGLPKALSSLALLRAVPERLLTFVARRLADRKARWWLLHLTSGRATTDDAVAFRRWCDKRASNRTAFARARHQWLRMLTVLGDGRGVAPHRPASRSAKGSAASRQTREVIECEESRRPKKDLRWPN